MTKLMFLITTWMRIGLAEDVAKRINPPKRQIKEDSPFMRAMYLNLTIW